jgi:hypothetical protein
VIDPDIVSRTELSCCNDFQSDLRTAYSILLP